MNDKVKNEIVQQDAKVGFDLAKGDEKCVVTVIQPETKDFGVSPMLQMVLDKDIDPERLAAFLEIQSRYEDREAKKLFNIALSQFQENMPQVVKDALVSYKHNDGKGETNWHHATLGRALATLRADLGKYGLALNWKTEVRDVWVTVTAKLRHIAGHIEENVLSGPFDNSGKKNVLQQMNSTVTYLERYTGFAVLGVSPEDADDDGAGGAKAGVVENNEERINLDQVTVIRDLIAEKGFDEEGIIKLVRNTWPNINSIEEIPVAGCDGGGFDKVFNWLDKSPARA